jgi:DNA-binding response OmpR family regulator
MEVSTLPASNGMKILLVDDDAFLRDMYATKFGEHGSAVNVAETADGALDMLSREEYDVVLLDMIMPGMSGVELLKRIKSEKLGGDPKCIILSNQGEKDDIEGALKAGAIGYIVKAELVPSEVVAEVMKLAS